MHCAVFGCKNNNKGDNVTMRAFTFPKCKKTRAKWIKFCRRSDFNADTSVICEHHFKKEDFSNNMQFDMGYAKRRKLNAAACPSVYTDEEPSEPTLSDCQRTERIKARERRKIVGRVLEQSAQEEDLNVQHEETFEEVPDVCVSCPDESEEIQGLKRQIDTLQQEIKGLRKENFTQKENIQNNLLPEISSLKLQLRKAEFKGSNMEKQLQNIFTSGQVRKIQNGSKRQRWTEEDIAKSIALYSTGAKTYKLLRRRQFPLPSIRTLRSWAQKLDVSPGILKPVVAIMSAANLTEAQKVCVLSFDDMKVKAVYNYDKALDATLAPAKYVQVVMLRDLMSKWKQPIFYNFDCKMTKDILFDIIGTCKECGYNIVAMVHDLGGGNRSVCNELDITIEKPWFLYEENKIFAFADVPHCLKLLRNHFIDEGLIIDGKKVDKGIVLELLSKTSSELSITHKISTKHLEVSGAERQKVKFAAKLFSHSIAQAITRAASLGVLESENWEQCQKLFKLVTYY